MTAVEPAQGTHSVNGSLPEGDVLMAEASLAIDDFLRLPEEPSAAAEPPLAKIESPREQPIQDIIMDEQQPAAEDAKGTALAKRVGYILSSDILRASDSLPSNENRSSMLHSLIIAYKLHEHMSIIPPEIASIEDLKEFHSSDYVDYLMEVEKLEDRNPDDLDRYGLVNDCPIFPNLANYVRLVAGGTISAAKLLTEGGYDVAIHWDGGRHHGKRDSACGFCYINDIVLGILELHKKYERILYLDLDIHHGDGVEQAFQTTSKVLTVSFHKYEPGFFPGTGSIDDVGYGKGLNHSLNIPLRPGFSGVGLRYLFSRVIDSAMENYNPDAIVIQCGADGLANDPLVGRGGWNLDERSIGECVAKTLSFNKPTLVLGGGGYGNPNAARCWAWCTAVIVQQEELISEDIPDHPFLNKYGPDFRLPVDLTFYKDRNDTRYVDDVIKKVTGILKKTRPGTFNHVEDLEESILNLETPEPVELEPTSLNLFPAQRQVQKRKPRGPPTELEPHEKRRSSRMRTSSLSTTPVPSVNDDQPRRSRRSVPSIPSPTSPIALDSPRRSRSPSPYVRRIIDSSTTHALLSQPGMFHTPQREGRSRSREDREKSQDRNSQARRSQNSSAHPRTSSGFSSLDGSIDQSGHSLALSHNGHLDVSSLPPTPDDRPDHMLPPLDPMSFIRYEDSSAPAIPSYYPMLAHHGAHASYPATAYTGLPSTALADPGLLQQLKHHVSSYLAGDSGNTYSLIIMNPKVAQKSYGTEKRFFCPPPLCVMSGGGWSTAHTAVNDSLATDLKMYVSLSEPIDEDAESATGLGVRNRNKSRVRYASPPLQAPGCGDMEASEIDILRTPESAVGIQPNSDLHRLAVFRNLFVNDAEKRKDFELFIRIQGAAYCAPFGSFKSKPIKVISKPSKKRLPVSKNGSLYIHSGTSVGMFNRVRSQTISTRFISVSADGQSLLPSYGTWDSFIIWSLDDPAFDKTDLLKNHEYLPDDEIICHRPSTSRFAGQLNAYMTPPVSPHLKRRTLPGATVLATPQSESVSVPPSPAVEHRALEFVSALDETGSNSDDVENAEDEGRVLLYGERVVLQHVGSGLLTRPFIICHIDGRGQITSDFGAGAGQGRGIPVCQLHKIAFQLADNPNRFLCLTDGRHRDRLAMNLVNVGDNTGASSSRQSSPARKKPRRSRSMVRGREAEGDDEGLGDMDTSVEVSPGDLPSDEAFRGADMSEYGVWSIIGINHMEYSFYIPPGNLASHPEQPPHLFDSNASIAGSSAHPIPIVHSTQVSTENPSRLTLFGENFIPDLVVHFGATPVLSAVINNPSTITIDVPPEFLLGDGSGSMGGAFKPQPSPDRLPILLARLDGVVYNTGHFWSIKID